MLLTHPGSDILAIAMVVMVIGDDPSQIHIINISFHTLVSILLYTLVIDATEHLVEPMLAHISSPHGTYIRLLLSCIFGIHTIVSAPLYLKRLSFPYFDPRFGTCFSNATLV